MKFLILFCCCATVLGSCRSTQMSSDNKAIYTDVTPADTETWTRARLRPLNRFANDLLSENEVKRDETGKQISYTGRKEPLQQEAERAFRNLGIDPAKVLPLNREGKNGKRGNYILGVAEDSDHCFFEGNFDRDLYWDDHRDQVIQQLEYAARFIKDFHVAIGGEVDQPFVFHQIEVCSRKSLGTDMIWRPGGKLEIGVPYWITLGGDYYPLKPNDLMDMWTSGAMFQGDDAVTMNLKKVWPLLNPMSRFRRQLVKTLLSWSHKLSQAIDQTKGTQNQDSAISLARQYVDSTLIGVDPAESVRKIIDAGKLEEFLSLWQTFIEDRANHEGLIGANMAAASEKIKVRNHADGWLVSVANYHRIAVEGSIASGNFKQYLKVDDPREVDIDISCKGAIAVCTIDDISVLLQFVQNNVHFDKSLETAGFVAARDAVLGAP